MVATAGRIMHRTARILELPRAAHTVAEPVKGSDSAMLHPSAPLLGHEMGINGLAGSDAPDSLPRQFACPVDS
jgi:hypothetical protein